MKTLPKSHKPYTDTYFIRSRKILEEVDYNPWVRYQMFIRDASNPEFNWKNNATVHGINEAINIIDKYSNVFKGKGRVYSLNNGSRFNSGETLMVIDAPVQDVIELETMLLGVVSAETSKRNDGTEIDAKKIRGRCRKIKQILNEDKDVLFFGSRHWRYDELADVGDIIRLAGWDGCATQNVADEMGVEPSGTVPHALEVVVASKYGRSEGVSSAIEEFNIHMDEHIPRVSLIDYNNEEFNDTYKSYIATRGDLDAVRIDTPGENYAQTHPDLDPISNFVENDVPNIDGFNYLTGTGVTIAPVYTLRAQMDVYGMGDVDIFLSSGFGNPEKVRDFQMFENKFGKEIFSGIGAGGIFDGRFATMDIVGVGPDSSVPYKDVVFNYNFAKKGRSYNPNIRLERVNM